MALSPTLIKQAKKLINKYGNTLVLKKITQGVYDPNTGESVDVVDSINTKGIDEEGFGENEGDMVVTFYTDNVIDAFDKVDYRGKERDIIAINQISIEDTTVVYQAIVTGDAREKV